MKNKISFLEQSFSELRMILVGCQYLIDETAFLKKMNGKRKICLFKKGLLMTFLHDSPLGQTVNNYPSTYQKSLLFPISRTEGRAQLGIAEGEKPFFGVDIWNAWEISWLNLRGKPLVAIGVFEVPCQSRYILESKSLKLYLNSLNGSRFESFEAVQQVIQRDLSEAAQAEVRVDLYQLDKFPSPVENFAGECIDQQDIEVDHFKYSEDFLRCAEKEDAFVKETLVSHLLKSNCPVTSQPDWASLSIEYSGPKICREGLLRYVLSFREHNEFHEQCVERIFLALLKRFSLESLTVQARYTRRGGLDINPIRSLEERVVFHNKRLVRQ